VAPPPASERTTGHADAGIAEAAAAVRVEERVADPVRVDDTVPLPVDERVSLPVRDEDGSAPEAVAVFEAVLLPVGDIVPLPLPVRVSEDDSGARERLVERLGERLGDGLGDGLVEGLGENVAEVEGLPVRERTAVRRHFGARARGLLFSLGLGLNAQNDRYEPKRE
jgi:hypothetical protein